MSLDGIGWETGGDDRNRTCDILLAKQTLYQLSYIPTGLKRQERVLDESRRRVKCRSAECAFSDESSVQ